MQATVWLVHQNGPVASTSSDVLSHKAHTVSNTSDSSSYCCVAILSVLQTVSADVAGDGTNGVAYELLGVLWLDRIENGILS